MSKVEFLPVSGQHSPDVLRAKKPGFTKDDLFFVAGVVLASVAVSVILTLVLVPQSATALMMSVSIPSAVATPASLYLVRQRAKVAALNAQLSELLRRDSLTGALSRRAFLAEVAEQSNLGGILILLDADHFKSVNDTYGHPAGDAVLVQLANRLGACAGKEALVGRLGGEEFAVFLPGIEAAGGRVKAEALREAVAGSPIQTAEAAFFVTVSLGVAPLGPERSLTETLAAADAALYAAKNSGRNQYFFEGSTIRSEDVPLKRKGPV